MTKKKEETPKEHGMDYSVPAWLWERWNRKCEEADIFLYEDLAGLLILSEVLPIEAHRTLANAAKSEVSRRLAAPLLREMQKAIYHAFGEDLPRESYPFEQSDKR
jgi:hypothetical protein